MLAPLALLAASRGVSHVHQSPVLLFQVANQVVQALLTQKVGWSSVAHARLLLTSDL